MTVFVDGVTKRFGTVAALDGVSLTVADGELVALLGPSGSGKTTLLRVLAGLEFADTGRIAIGGQDVADVPARDRRIGFVFQHYALFRHMSVFENVAFGLKVRPRATRPSKGEIRDRVTALLGRMQIADLATRFPDQVSGGQRQRVALARALATEPRVLLLDEPFGALDAQVRKDLRRWLRRLHDDMGLTSVLVTHDQEEAMDLADRVVLMDRGRIVQAGTPREIRDRPATAFVQAFLGGANRFEVTVAGGLAKFATAPLPPVRVALPDGPAVAYVEPHDLILSPGRGPGIVRRVTLSGPLLRVDVDLGGQAIEALVGDDDAGTATLVPGVPVGVEARRVRVFIGVVSAVGTAVGTAEKSSPADAPEKEPTSIP
jgi:sulfate transport system ATP-binding protein